MPILPQHDVLILDEAHEFVDRVTAAISVELDTAAVRRTIARVADRIEPDLRDRAEDAVGAVETSLAAAQPGRVRTLPEDLLLALTLLRDAGHGILPSLVASSESDAGAVARLRAVVEEIHEAAARILSAGPDDVLWTEQTSDRLILHVSPLDVGAVLRGGRPTTVIATSATMIGPGGPKAATAALGLDDDTVVVDVGSPFDFARQGILYIASRVPAPDRDGVSMDALDEMAMLIDAAGGRTLGLFSSWRGVERAAEYLRVRTPGLTVHVQQRGESPARVISAFASDEESVLLGTVSLWQGIDVPGRACILVVIDRIPFPRPEDPMTSARAERAEEHGRSGFMDVSVARAGLLLAQGAGRLIRSAEDRGVVAILDPRMASARYASAIRAAMPPLWPTSDRELVLAALRRLAD
jgi:ATP-dependent DNA helicase DinG